MCQLLIRHGANVNSQNEQGRSPLWRAAFMDRRECVELLLQHGADPTIHSVTLDTAACVAPSAELKEIIAEFPRERTLQLQAERAAYLDSNQWKPPEEDADDAPCGATARCVWPARVISSDLSAFSVAAALDLPTLAGCASLFRHQCSTTTAGHAGVADVTDRV